MPYLNRTIIYQISCNFGSHLLTQFNCVSKKTPNFSVCDYKRQRQGFRSF